MRYLKLQVRVFYESSPMTTNSPYVTVVDYSQGFTLDVVLPWHARLYRVIWFRSSPSNYGYTIPVTTGAASNMGNVQFSNGYEGMRVKQQTSGNYYYIYGYCCNDIPNTTVYNEAVTDGYLNRIRIGFYNLDGTAVSYSGYTGYVHLVYCFDDDDPTYDDMLANGSPSSAVSVVAEDWSLTMRKYQPWYVKNDGTLPYLKAWDSLYPPYRLYIGDDPVDTMYFREHLAKVYLGDLEL